MRRSLTVHPVELQGRLQETRYRKRDDGQLYQHDGNADLWLVETSDGRRGTLAIPRRGDGWTRDGSTYWLTNPPPERPMSKRTSRKTARRKTKRPPPRGFKTWSAYMASIRPNGGGGKMARRKRRANPPKRRRASTRRRSVVVVNPPRHVRRRARRNPPAFLGGVVNKLTHGAVHGTVIVATQVGARLVRSRALGMSAGTAAAFTELGIAAAAGLVAERFVGQDIGQTIVDAGFANAIRTMAKQIGGTSAADLLGDDAPALRNFAIRRGGRLAGYVGPRSPLGNYVGGGSSAVNAAAAMMANAGG